MSHVLTPGSRLGDYHIREFIGAGGMGQVYRAHDPRLKRDVALKVLPQSVASDPDRLARFRREAEILASVNHAGIASIYGIEEASPSADAGPPLYALVMEFVDGEDLSQRLARGPMALDDTLPIARQICDALEAAHNEGIVHRDLKPANIKLRPDGTVKVLDFGLARPGRGATAADNDLPDSPTITSPAVTEAGVILGTAAYMAPEQAKGRRVDKRADIWAFGCVLYEMLTSTRLFGGEDVSEVLAAVLRQDIDWKPLPPSTPPGVRWLLQRCLERDLELRLRDLGDARLLLSTELVGPPREPTRSRSTTWIVAAVTAAVVAAAAGMAWNLSGRLARAAPPLRIVEVSDTADAAFPAISPDGLMVAYVKPDGLWLRRLDRTSTDRIVTRSSIGSLAWSPAANALAFFDGDGVSIVRTDGSAEQTVWRPTPQVRFFRSDVGLAWSGNALYVPTFEGIMRIPADGGEGTIVAAWNDTPGVALYRHPVVLNDGETILVSPGVLAEDKFDFGTIWAFRAGKGQQVLSMSEVGIEGLSYLPRSQTLLIATADEKRLAIWSSTFDTKAFAATAPRPVTEGVAPSLPSSDGTVALVTGLRPRAPVLRQFTATGKELRVVPQPHFDLRNLALSPDGQRLAFRAATTVGKGASLFVFDSERGVATSVASVGAGAFPAWSPDGRMLAVTRSGGFLDVVQPGQGTSRTLEQGVTAGPFVGSTTWTPDSREILFVRERGGDAELAGVSVDDGGQPQPRSIARIPALIGAALAPSGRYVAYVAGVPGRAFVWVADFPALSSRVQVSSEAAGYPQWSSRGDEVWFVQGGEFVAVPITVTRGELTAGAKRTLFRAPSGLSLTDRIAGRLFATMDGKEFWIVDGRNEGEAHVTLVQNVDQLVARATR